MKISVIKYGYLSNKELESPTHPGIYFLKRLEVENNLQVITYSDRNKKFILRNNSNIINTSFKNNPRYFLFHFIKIFFILVRFNPDILITWGEGITSLSPWLYSIIFNKRMICLVAGEVRLNVFKIRLRNILLSLIMLIFKSKTILKIFAVSNRVNKQLIDLGVPISKVETYEYQYPTNFLKRFNDTKKRVKKGKFVITFIGRLTKDKGVLDILEIAKYFIDQKEVIFNIIGEGALKKELIKKINKYHLKKKVVLLEHVDHIQIPRHIINSDILLHPTYHEALGLVIVESILANRPIVASSVGGIADIIKDGKEGFLVSPGEIISFVKAINKLQNKDTYQKISQNIEIRKKSLLNPKKELYSLVIRELSKFS